MNIVDISTKRRVTIAMFTLAVILFGFVSFLRLKINLLPELSYPTLTIRTEYPGAAPVEVENLISKPIEEALGVVKNVNRVSSISRSGQSDVLLEFAWGTNMDYAGLDVREKLDAIYRPVLSAYCPAELLEPPGVGEEQPDSGELRIGPTVELGYVDQNRDALKPDSSVFQEISGGAESLEMGGRKIHARAYVSRFNFRGPDQEKKVGELSGGERNRVHLARMLKEGANVLLLDEPTNDLDVNTMRALEEALENFAGCALVISHDRWFLDRIVTHILAFEGDSRVVFYDGSYSEYEADRKARLGAAADQPHRIHYRHLTRG